MGSGRRVYFAVGTRVYTGPTLQDIIDRNKYLKTFFDRNEFKGIVRHAGRVAGELWAHVFLPMRFDMSYAKRLGYRATTDYNRFKEARVGQTVMLEGKNGFILGGARTIRGPQPTPFMYTGSSKDYIFSKYHVDVVVKNESVTIKVVFRLGNIAFLNRDVFLTVPAAEYARVATEFHNEITRSVKDKLTNGGVGNVDSRILQTKTRGVIDASLRPSFMQQRKAI
jgi:hypothetical protein